MLGTGGPSSLHERGRDSCLRAVLCYKRLFTKACMGCKQFFVKERKNVMPCCILCCLPASQAVLKRFRRVSTILVFHCWKKDKAEQWFQECPSLEANNSAGKLPLASIPPEIQSRDVAVPCPFTRFAIPPTDRSLAMLLSIARPASEFQTRLVQTAVDPFTDRIVCRVTKISLARVASGVNGFVCLSTGGRCLPSPGLF